MGGACGPENPPARAPVVERRTAVVTAPVSAAEFADWRAKAAAAGVPLSAVNRRAMASTRMWTVPAAEVERERPRQVARIGNDVVVYREVTFPVRLGSWTGARWEIVDPYEWQTCFGGPSGLPGEYSR